ncbi:hypothetical protein CURTO8I2_220191 [Curtobacterium sp. 8I-2]|nr:hypothetical protein CURTO8I2_220191 [Curtobacterium sp. 8I-2]
MIDVEVLRRRIATEWDRNAEAVRALPGYSDA